MVATTIEQSRHLVELGINPNTADMHYVRKIRDFRGNPVDGKFSIPKYGNTESKHANYMVQNFTDYELLPAWSLGALLKLIPYPTLSQQYTSLWNCMEFPNEGEAFNCESPIEAAYKLVCRLKENKSI